MVKKKTLEVLHYYILAFFLLMGYYLAQLIGLVPWAFNNLSLPVMLLVLTIWYGTVLWIVDTALHKFFKL